MYRKQTPQLGFTIIEMMAAMAVFAVLAVMAYGGLRSVVNAREAVEESGAATRSLQRAFFLISQDIEQFQARAIRDEFGDPQPAVQSGGSGRTSALEFTRGGWPTPFDIPQSGQIRVRYQIEGEQLIRSNWVVLDRAQDSLPTKTALLNGVTALEFRYLDDSGSWKNEWPPTLGLANPQPPSGATPATTNPQLVQIPAVIELRLGTEQWGEIIYLLRLDNLS